MIRNKDIVHMELSLISNAVLAVVKVEDPDDPSKSTVERIAITSQAQLVRLISQSFRKVL